VAEQKYRKAHCNECGGDKTHHVLGRYSSRWENEEASISGGTHYEMLKCGGCEKVVLREEDWCSEDWPGPEREPRFYPPATFRPAPKWLTNAEVKKEKLCDLMSEVYIALQNDQPYLAAMGIRAALEYIMIDKVKDNGSFAKNLSKFKEADYVSVRQCVLIETALEVGHAAIHRAHKPTKEAVTAIVDLTEGLIQMIYLHGPKVGKLKGKTPRRKKIKKSAIV